jgi:hypothetical protein
MMYPATIAVFLLCLSGCTARGAKFQDSPYATSPVPTDLARIIFLRPYDFQASARSVPIDIDGKTVARLANNGFVSLEVAPGEHEIASSIWDIPGRFSIRLQVEAGRSHYIGVSPRQEHMKHAWMAAFGLIGGLVAASLQDASGPFKLEPIEEQQAMKLLLELKLSE